ncbi:MAG: 4-hydroxy-3-methylbut-2-enyl diphosphate reductase [Cyclobacteriaceae bacterium]|nr:4-hydroxy-3-methylbut-2-enyl diphosphate reductase [Cyclobacteriaceae bacterium]MCH8516280.1 4-hydroxy-3-methylbut-2-enyl diphosphate reductase [Cyclobacteriaceae bacterium]
MKIEIDKNSGYCFGVEYAIQMAEAEMMGTETLYCLGDIVHNAMEVNRLNAKGLQVISRDELKDIKDAKVLIRAHGEPPETYQIALNNNIELIDASCPVVLKLQNRIKHAWDTMSEQAGQVVIYGQPGHAEVLGLQGQTQNKAIIVTTEDDLEKIDFSRPIILFSQTTKSTRGFYAIRDKIKERIVNHLGEDGLIDYTANDSICRQVSNREPQLKIFANQHDLILFVSGKKSSNGKALYQVCKGENPRSYFIENADDLQPEWFEGVASVGICGATSTPMWLMEEVAEGASSFSDCFEGV